MATFEEQLPASAAEIIEKSKADIRKELLKVNNANRPDPFAAGDFLSAIPIADGNRIFDFYIQLKAAKRLNFPHTAEGENAEAWGSILIGSHLPEEPAEGYVIVTGENNALVPTSRKFTSPSGFEYEIVNSYKISPISISAISYQNNGGQLVFTFQSAHYISSDCDITVSDFIESVYNKVYTSPVILDAFRVQVEAPNLDTPTGNPSVSFLGGRVYLRAILDENLNAEDSNLPLGSSLSLDIPVSGVNNDAIVSGGEISGGVSYESEDEFKARYLDRLKNPIAHYNDAAIKKQVTAAIRNFKLQVVRPGDTISENAVSSITRSGLFALVETPVAHGLFTGAKTTITGANEELFNLAEVEVIYIDDFKFGYIVSGEAPSSATGTILYKGVMPLGRNIVYVFGAKEQKILSSSAINLAAEAVQSILPVNTPASFVETKSPNTHAVDFVFTSLDEDNNGMRGAIQESLNAYFDNQSTVGGYLDKDEYRSAIIETINPDNGNKLKSFVLSSPLEDVAKITGSLPVLGQVLFNVT
jgi:uncharacterized phage protein gp47/JayE